MRTTRRPPSSPPFPYTTLFRSPERLDPEAARVLERPLLEGARVERGRSEEHTSELQSLRHLVCRLLLEKKKRLDKLPQIPTLEEAGFPRCETVGWYSLMIPKDT